ncbi:RNA polymerase sigma factor [Bacteroidota bacterium]
MDFESDNVYIDKVLAGDSGAYRFLVEKHKDLVYTIALKITGKKEDAEEISQDAFLKAYQKLSSFQSKSKFSTWIFRIAYNTAISKVRKKKVINIDIDDVNLDGGLIDDIQEEISEQNHWEKKKLINTCLQKLNELDYTIVSLFYLKENTIDDISEITGLSKSNVKVKLHRIRKKLYDQMHQMLNSNVTIVTPNV